MIRICIGFCNNRRRDEHACRKARYRNRYGPSRSALSRGTACTLDQSHGRSCAGLGRGGPSFTLKKEL